MLVEPDLEGIADHACDQLHRLARVELFLDLTLELRIENARREHIGHTGADVVLLQLDAARQQRTVLDEGLDGIEDAGAQAGFVRAAGHGRNQIDVGLGSDRIDMPAESPGGAFAGGEIGMIGVGIFFGGVERGDGLCVAGQFRQVTGKALRIAPGLAAHAAVGQLDVEAYLDAGQQHGLGTQQAFQFRRRHTRRIEVFRIGPDAHPGAALAAATADFGQGADGFAAAGKIDGPDLSFAPHFDRDAGGERVGDRHADAVQSAGKGIGRIAQTLVELAAGMEPGEGQYHHRNFLVGVQADRDTAAIVGHRDRAIRVEQDVKVFRMAAQGFIGGIVDHFLNDVSRRIGLGVHAGALAYRLQSLEDTE